VLGVAVLGEGRLCEQGADGGGAAGAVGVRDVLEVPGVGADDGGGAAARETGGAAGQEQEVVEEGVRGLPMTSSSACSCSRGVMSGSPLAPVGAVTGVSVICSAIAAPACWR
jgi:hypothetical protein